MMAQLGKHGKHCIEMRYRRNEGIPLKSQVPDSYSKFWNLLPLLESPNDKIGLIIPFKFSQNVGSLSFSPMSAF